MESAYTAPWNSPDFDGTDAERGKAMVEAAKQLDAGPMEGYRRDLNLELAKMFDSQPISSLFLYAGAYYANSGGSYASFSLADAATWNVLRSVCMTAAAMIGRSRPRARFVTTGGNIKQKRRAKKATQFADGWAAEEDLYSVTFEALVDALRFDVGAVQVYEEGNRVKIQRVFPSEIRVDAVDAMYGSPRTIYRRRFVSKDRLIAQFGKGKPELKEVIQSAKTIDPIGVDTKSGLVAVEEAWHLPSSPDATDGYHIIAIDEENGTLFSEAWVKPYFPILFLTWEKATSGYTGISLAMQLAPIQLRINKMLDREDRAQKLMCVPRIAIKRGSKIVKGAISNLIAGAIEYTDTPPQALVWPALPPEFYKSLEDHVQKAYDLPGISRNAAQGQKEQGTVAAVAIREALDVQQTRLQVFTQKYETFHVSIFKVVIDMVADIVARKKGYEVTVPGSKLLDKVDWKEIGLDESEFKITVYPVNQLPMTPQGRLDFVQDMLKSGLWDVDRCRAALEDLDISSAEGLEDSVYNLLSKHFEAMIYDGEPKQPSELAVGNYQLAMRLGQQYLALGELDDAPEKHLDLVRRYLKQLKQDNAALNPPPAPPAPANDNGQPPAAAPLSPLPPAFVPAAA